VKAASAIHPGTIRRALLGGLACVSLAAAGCGTAAGRIPGNAVEVRMQGRGLLAVAGETLPPSRLPRKLKAMGAGRDTTIRILVGEQTPRSSMAAIARELASAGFPKILFTRPRRASSSSELSGQTRGRSGTSAATAPPRP